MSGWKPGLLAVAVAAGLVPAAAGGASAEVLRASGTGTALGAFRQLMAAFEKANPGHTVKLLPSVGSSGAIRAVAEGALELGLSGRALLPRELAPGIQAFQYARTPFIIAVGPRVGVSSITATELAHIYRGDTTTWPNGERIRPIMRPDFDADTRLLRAISPELDAAMGVALAREGLVMAATNQECDLALARTPGSIGPSALTQIATESPAVRPLAWQGVAPTLENLASGAYPLEKPVFVVIRSNPSPGVRRFMAFLGSPEARLILERTGNLPVPLPQLP
jgi:phosphate transport system substrate-binding protein